MNWLNILDAFNVGARIERWIGSAVKRDAGHKITLPRTGQMSGRDAEKLLKRRGVAVWGGRTTSDKFVFYVKRRQARWAEYILKQATAGNPPPAWIDKVNGD